MSKRILLDPGHFGNYNPSPVCKTYYEGNQMWKLSQYLTEALRGYGFEVGCTKPSINSYPSTSGKDDVFKRGSMAKGYDLMISLHSNACGTESVNRAVIVHPMSGKYVDIAKKIGACVKVVMGVSSYQLAQRDYNTGAFYYDGKAHNGKDYYGVIRGAVAQGVPCIIIEHGFHTNTAVAKWLMSDANLKKLAEAEAKTIAEYFGQTKKPTPSTPTNTVAPLEIYRVRKSWEDAKSQLGSYMVLDYAKAQVDKNPGYYVFDSNGDIVYPTVVKKTVDELAREVIAGKWGNGSERKRRLTQAGYDCQAVQTRVNEMLK